MFSFVPGFLFGLASNTAASGPACSSRPYTDLLFLSRYAPATSFCAWRFPSPTPVCTASTISVSTLTTEVTINVASPTITEFVTTGEPTIVTDTSTVTPPVVTEFATVTVTTTTTLAASQASGASSGANVRRDTSEKEPRNLFDVPNNVAASLALRKLQASATSVVKTLCGCIGTTAACTTTTTTSTIFTEVTNTATSYYTTYETSFVANTETITQTETTTLTPETVTETATKTATATACPGALTLCGDSCKDLTSDRDNCGTCNNHCPVGNCANSKCNPCFDRFTCTDSAGRQTPDEELRTLCPRGNGCRCYTALNQTTFCGLEEVANTPGRYQPCTSDKDCSNGGTCVKSPCNVFKPEGAYCKGPSRFSACANPANIKRMFSLRGAKEDYVLFE